MPIPLRHLQLAFAYHRVVELIGIDSQVDTTELSFLHTAFPHDELRACGLVDASGAVTSLFAEALERAAIELPERLTTGEKLALVDLVAAASAADGVLVAEEADALGAVARSLGVGDGEWLDHIEGLIASGQLTRGA